MSPQPLADRIRSHDARLAIVGQGYVGLPLAVEFARVGFRVTGLDTDLDRVGALNAGRSYIQDVASAELEDLLGQGRYAATGDAGVLADSDAVIICVPTPLGKSKDPDISFVMAAAEQVAARLRPGQLVVLESTTYPGTTEELLLPLFEARGRRVGRDFHLAFSPERIDPGNRSFPVRAIPKIVGGVTPACRQLTALLYQQIVSRVVEVASPRVAELAKLYENVFRNVNIALANELALMCHRLGVSTRDVIDAAATKPFGFLPFYPGPGIGGHCIGIDPIYLAWKMRLSGYDSRFIQLADEINRAMPLRTVEMVAEALNRQRLSVNGARVLALGVAYKRDIGDMRESPALEVLARLRERGAVVSYADPHVPSVDAGDVVLKAVELTDRELVTADCVVILTDHSQVDYRHVVETARLVVDMRNATWGIPAPDGRVIRV
ncbi:MAG: nucleotide sugar dehydrogenase [Candidatus Rokuibacteriota bacterium]